MTQRDTVGAALPRHEEALVESGHDVLDIDGTIATNKN